MRIIAGKFKGSLLHIPSGKKTRPLKDMVRESVFNLLSHSTTISFRFEESNVLDLYAGTGSFGLECLSRHAENVFFIEKEKLAYKILVKNIEKFKINKKTKIFFDDVFSVISKKKFLLPKFDLIFCDPPFKNINIEKLISLIFNNNLLRANGILVIHRNKNEKEKLPLYLKILDERIYGKSKIIFANFLS